MGGVPVGRRQKGARDGRRSRERREKFVLERVDLGVLGVWREPWWSGPKGEYGLVCLAGPARVMRNSYGALAPFLPIRVLKGVEIGKYRDGWVGVPKARLTFQLREFEWQTFLKGVRDSGWTVRAVRSFRRLMA